MANEQFAFLKKGDVPNRNAWQAVIDDCKFDFQLDPNLTPFEDSGFLPCILEGSQAGFEIYYDDSIELLSQFDGIRQGHDYCVSFRWGGSMKECASVMIACYALAKGFGAIVSYEGEEPYEDLGVLLAETQEILKDARLA